MAPPLVLLSFHSRTPKLAFPEMPGVGGDSPEGFVPIASNGGADQPLQGWGRDLLLEQNEVGGKQIVELVVPSAKVWVRVAQVLPSSVRQASTTSLGTVEFPVSVICTASVATFDPMVKLVLPTVTAHLSWLVPE